MNRRDFSKLPFFSAAAASAATTSAKAPVSAQDVIWIPPTLCGCALRIEADWTDGSITRKGTSYRHPIPHTIRQIGIMSVCPAHEFSTLEALPEFPYGEEYHQEGGYIRLTTQPSKVWRNDVGEIVEGPRLLDPAQATPAERLYIHLYRYCGNVVRPHECECAWYQWFDRNDTSKITIVEHPLHTRVCERHSAGRAVRT